jgi:DNA-binding transcriptional ArsR family regulator
MLAIWLTSYMADGQDDSSTAPVFKALADPTRRQILQELHNTELAAGDVASRFPISGPSISRHLAVLKAAGLVKERRDANKIIYSLVPDRLATSVGSFLAGLCPDQMLPRDRQKKKVKAVDKPGAKQKHKPSGAKGPRSSGGGTPGGPAARTIVEDNATGPGQAELNAKV